MVAVEMEMVLTAIYLFDVKKKKNNKNKKH